MRRCIARDVSGRGLFVETYEHFPLGTELRVTFSLPDGSWEMSVWCTVRRSVRLDAGDGVLHGIGLSFEDVADEPDVRSGTPRRADA